MGKAFKEDVQSTEGISIHRIKSKFKKSAMTTEEWIEKTLDKSNFLEDLNPDMLAKINGISAKTRKMSRIPWQSFQAPSKIPSAKQTLKAQTSEEKNLQSSPHASCDVSHDQLSVEEGTSPTQDQTGRDTDENTDESNSGTKEDKDTDVRIFHQKEQLTNEVQNYTPLAPLQPDEVNKDKTNTGTEEETYRDISQTKIKTSDQQSDDISIQLHQDQAADFDPETTYGEYLAPTETAEHLLERERREGEDHLKTEVNRKSHSEEYPINNLEEDVVNKAKSERETKTQEENSMKKEIPMVENISEEGIPFSATIWDFSGQNEFIATHHLFLDAESSTLIIMDITKPLDQNLDTNSKLGHPSSPGAALHYWLNSLYVRTYQKLQPKVAIVLTHKDMIEDDNIETYVKSYKKGILSTVKGHPYANFITEDNIHIVDNKLASEKDFQNLRNQLLQYFSQQDIWGKQIPLRWMKLKYFVIEKTGIKEKGYMPSKNVITRAKEYGIFEKEFEAFLKIQDTTGHFVDYPDLGLREIIFTDPKWLVGKLTALTTYIKGLQAEDALHDKSVHVTKDSLKEMWKGMDIEFLEQFIKMLNVNFNLIIPVDESGQRYIIPSLLHQTHDETQGQAFDNMEMIYSADHTPKLGNTFIIGTFHQLIAKSSKIKSWKLCAGDNHPSYTGASFEMQKGIRLVLHLLKMDKLQVSIWCEKKTLVEDTSNLIKFVEEPRYLLSPVMEKLGIAQSDTFLVLCPYSKSTDVHPCMVPMTEYQHPTPNRFSYWSSKQKCDLHEGVLRKTMIPSLLMLASGK